MQLFTIQNQYPYISTEALLIPAFADIWNRDKTKDKSIASKELAYVYFMADYRSPFGGLSPEVKEDEIIKDLFRGKFHTDEKIQAAIEKYEQLQDSLAMRFLKSAQFAVEQSIKYYNSVNYTDVDTKGNFLYKIKEVNASVKEASGLLDGLEKLVEKVRKAQQINESKQRGGGSGGFFESR
jgi:hypothetical protein